MENLFSCTSKISYEKFLHLRDRSCLKFCDIFLTDVMTERPSTGPETLTVRI